MALIVARGGWWKLRTINALIRACALHPHSGLPPSLLAQRFLIRARQYRAQAILLADMEGFEPNWPKYF